MVVEARRLQRMFEDFGAVSGLRLDLRKITIPLGIGTLWNFRETRGQRLPGWSDMTSAECGKYFGFLTPAAESVPPECAEGCECAIGRAQPS